MQDCGDPMGRRNLFVGIQNHCVFVLIKFRYIYSFPKIIPILNL